MTSLYAHNFTLLPRPARSVLSLGNEATRARLPDFDDVEQLRQFVDRLSVWRLDKSSVHGTIVHFKIGASFVGFLIVVICLTIGRRMYDKSFWLIRIIKKSSGRVIVPNAMLSFASVQGIFASVYVAFIWQYCDWFGGHPRGLPHNPMLWLGLTWWPLLCGASSAAWGTYFATPQDYQATFGVRKRSQLQRFFSHAYTINTLGLVFPIGVGAAIAGPASLSNRGYVKGLQMSQAWQARYGNETDFSQAMLQDAQRVWFQVIDGMRMANVLFYIWSCAAILICIAYSMVSMRLLSSIYGELERREQSPVRVFDIVTTHIFSKGDDDDDDDDDGDADEEDSKGPATTRQQRAAAQRRADRLMKELREAAALKESRERNAIAPTLPFDAAAMDGIAATSEIVPADRPSLPKTTRLVRTQLPEEPVRPTPAANPSNATEAGAPRTGLRLLLPNMFMQKNAAAGGGVGTSSRSAQMRALRKAFIHILIQFIAVGPACAVMGGVALMLAITMYGSMEQPSRNGGTRYERILTIALLTADVCICLFGAITLIAIASKTYEDVLSSAFQGRSSGNVTSGSGSEGGGSASNAASPTRPSRSRSVGLGRVLGRPGGRQERRRSINHAMSTFFETHTRTGRVPAPVTRNRSSNSSQQALQLHAEVLKGKECDVEQGLVHEHIGGQRSTTVSTVESGGGGNTEHHHDDGGESSPGATLSPCGGGGGGLARSTTASSGGTVDPLHQHDLRGGGGGVTNASSSEQSFCGGTRRT